MAKRLRLALERFRTEASHLTARSLARQRSAYHALLSRGATDLLLKESGINSAYRRFSPLQWAVFAGIAAGFGLSLVLFPRPAMVAINAIIILHSLALLALRIAALGLTLSEPRPPLIQPASRLADEDLPVITILCPMYKEAGSLPNLIGALRALDYPSGKLDIKLVLEADDHETLEAARRLATGPMFDIVAVPEGGPRTKPKACNYALWSAKGDLLVIYDAEDRPAPSQLRRAADAFADLPEDVACLQARLNYYNRSETWLTRLFAAEYALIFDIMLPGLARMGAPLPLGGTSNIFRTDILAEVGGWDPYNVTEDADIGLRLSAAGYRTAMLDATTLEEATSQVRPWFRQRTRWIKGYIQTWAVHSRRRSPTFGHAVTLHLLVGGVVTAALVNPVLWTTYLLWITGMADLGWLFPGPLGAMATLAFLGGNLMLLWLYMIAPLRRRWHDLVPYAMSAPLYWMLQSAAGYRAAWQFFRAPHQWEKTHHHGNIELEAIDPRDLETTG